ncbi:MAG: hypothetical protein ABJH08_13415 [Balneola sp.]
MRGSFLRRQESGLFKKNLDSGFRHGMTSIRKEVIIRIIVIAKILKQVQDELIVKTPINTNA